MGVPSIFHLLNLHFDIDQSVDMHQFKVTYDLKNSTWIIAHSNSPLNSVNYY